jgi:hypothetical protein
LENTYKPPKHKIDQKQQKETTTMLLKRSTRPALPSPNGETTKRNYNLYTQYDQNTTSIVETTKRNYNLEMDITRS